MKTMKVWPRKFVYIYFMIRTCNGKVYIFSGSHLIKLDAMHTTLPSWLKITTTQKQINFLTVTFFYLFNRLISFLQFPMSASLYSNSHFLKKSEKNQAMQWEKNTIWSLFVDACYRQVACSSNSLGRKVCPKMAKWQWFQWLIMKEVEENITQFNIYSFSIN